MPTSFWWQAWCSDLERDLVLVPLQAAADISSLVGSMLDPNDLIQRVVELIRERFDLY
jgi:hypothetical protein